MFSFMENAVMEVRFINKKTVRFLTTYSFTQIQRLDRGGYAYLKDVYG